MPWILNNSVSGASAFIAESCRRAVIHE
jgi:hypothetical protein